MIIYFIKQTLNNKKSFEVLKEDHKPLSNNTVYRTAPATLGV